MTRETAQKTTSLAVIGLVGALGSVAGALLSSTEIAGRLMRPQIVIVADERMRAIMAEDGPKVFPTRREWDGHLDWGKGRADLTDQRYRELREDIGEVASQVKAINEILRQLSQQVGHASLPCAPDDDPPGAIIRAATASEVAAMTAGGRQ